MRVFSDKHFANIRPTAVLLLKTGDRVFYASLEKNPAAEAFVEHLNRERFRLTFRSFVSSEPLPWSLPLNDEPITVRPGDLLFRKDGRLTLCREKARLVATRLACVGYHAEELLALLASQEDIPVEFSLEWSE